jgi:hypothetical protein
VPEADETPEAAGVSAIHGWVAARLPTELAEADGDDRRGEELAKSHCATAESTVKAPPSITAWTNTITASG